MLGVDVSHWNGPVDFRAAAAAGIRFSFCKATEGTSYTDPTFLGHVRDAYAAGVIPGAFHFARPAASSPVVQAHHYLQTIEVLHPGLLLLALDLEDDGALDPHALGAWTYEYLATVDAAMPQLPLLYLPDYFAPCVDRTRLGRWPLWLADVHGDATVPTPWTGWTVWQYDASQRVPGVASRACDRDRFAGSIEALRALASGTPHPPPAEPAPAPNPTPPEDTVLILARHAASTATFITDGITRRWVRNEAERDELIHAGIVSARVTILDKSHLDAIQLVGPPPPV